MEIYEQEMVDQIEIGAWTKSCIEYVWFGLPGYIGCLMDTILYGHVSNPVSYEK